MSSELQKIEALAKLHVSHPKEMEQRLKAVLEYVGQLKRVKFDVEPVGDDHVMDIRREEKRPTPKLVHDAQGLKTNCPKLEDDQVVVPPFMDKT